MVNRALLYSRVKLTRCISSFCNLFFQIRDPKCRFSEIQHEESHGPRPEITENEHPRSETSPERKNTAIQSDVHLLRHLIVGFKQESKESSDGSVGLQKILDTSEPPIILSNGKPLKLALKFPSIARHFASGLGEELEQVRIFYRTGKPVSLSETLDNEIEPVYSRPLYPDLAPISRGAGSGKQAAGAGGSIFEGASIDAD